MEIMLESRASLLRTREAGRATFWPFPLHVLGSLAAARDICLVVNIEHMFASAININ